MASGTKITLLVVVLLVIGTGVYWAAVGPGPARTTASSPGDQDGAGAVIPDASKNGRPATTPPGGTRNDTGPRPTPVVERPRTTLPPTITQGPPVVPNGTRGDQPDPAAPARTPGEVSRRPGDAGPFKPIVPIDTSPGVRPPVDPTIPAESDGKGVPPAGATGIPNRGSTDSSGRENGKDVGDAAGSRPVRPAPAGGAPPTTAPPAPPAAAPKPADASPATPSSTEYTVAEGDTMTSIAEAWFGDRGKWDLIAKANPYADPTRLKIGQKLRLPPKTAQREEPKVDPGTARGESAYIVRSGDTLSSIARVYYGNSAEWRTIYEANRQLIGEDPAALKVGMSLRIPPPSSGAKGR